MNVLCVPKVDLASCRGQRRACRWRVIVGVGAVSEACGSDDNYSGIQPRALFVWEWRLFRSPLAILAHLGIVSKTNVSVLYSSIET
jgi:hypothetical protein